MNISIISQPVNGKVSVTVKLHEEIEDMGQTASVNLWVSESDSRKELERRGRVALKAFLQRALSALDE